MDLGGANVVVIHNGVDVARLELAAVSSSAPFMPSDGGAVLLSLGTFEHQKGHDVLVRAFAEVLAIHPGATLVILGRSGPNKAATQELVSKLGLQARVVLLADVAHEDALAALRWADVYVLPSRNEAFSVALLEAGAFAKPVVATDVCGVRELVADGETGLVVAPDDPHELSKGLLRMLDDPAWARECGKRLHDVVLKRFTEQETARQYLESLGLLNVVHGGASPQY
jgi:glycosyltransferase involved in cell wall biosynthesis